MKINPKDFCGKHGFYLINCKFCIKEQELILQGVCPDCEGEVNKEVNSAEDTGLVKLAKELANTLRRTNNDSTRINRLVTARDQNPR